MTKKKFKNLMIFLLCMFIISVIYTVIDNHTNHSSAYTLGYSTGINFRHVIKLFGSLALILLAYRKFKTKEINNNTLN